MILTKSIPFEFDDIHYVLRIEKFNFFTWCEDSHKVDTFVDAIDLVLVFWILSEVLTNRRQ